MKFPSNHLKVGQHVRGVGWFSGGSYGGFPRGRIVAITPETITVQPDSYSGTVSVARNGGRHGYEQWLSLIPGMEEGRVTTIYYAEVDTSHFTFRAAGTTEAHARRALMAAWRSHVHNTRRQGGYIDPDYVNIDDANVLEMPLGQGFLDWEPAGKAVAA